MNYKNGYIPNNYHCKECKAHGCKLWHLSYSFSINLLCANCAIQNQSRPGAALENYPNLIVLNEMGTYKDNEFGYETDQIGSYVPAVPTEDLSGYWGYTSVPRDGCEWWYKLPTYKG